MQRYWVYFVYLMRHKWYVFWACVSMGIVWQGFVHDWHKLMPREFIPYARFFYNSDGSKKEMKRDKTGYYKPDFTGDVAFDMAWFWHQKLGKHHWQYWTHPASGNKDQTIVHEIPEKYLKEILADWIGAGLAQGTPDTKLWYITNRNKIHLYPQSRQWIERKLGIVPS